ncbi:MAG: hypothetical protein ACRD2J_07440 [Thermoanaerobaculia bacterium]
MTIYGEFDSQFRKKPAVWRLFVIGLAAALIASVVVSLLVGLAVGMGGKATQVRETALVLFVPPVVVGSPLLDAAMGTWRIFPIVTAAMAVILAIVIIWFWPADPTLAWQIVLNELASALVTFAGLTIAAESILARRSYLRSVAEVAGEIAIVVVALVVAVLAERKLVAILSNLVSMESPARRVGMWLARIAIPFSLLGALAWFEGSLATALAVGAFLVVTLFENLAHRPVPAFVQLRDVQMTEAAATLPLIAAALVAGSVWLFGGVPFRPDRALIWDRESGVTFAAPSEAWKETGFRRLVPRESEIDIRWSKDES